jgi:hypothetical protein
MTAELRLYLRVELSKIKRRWWLADLRIARQEGRRP